MPGQRAVFAIRFDKGWAGVEEIDDTLSVENITRASSYLGVFVKKKSLKERRKYRKFPKRTVQTERRDHQYCHFQKS